MSGSQQRLLPKNVMAQAYDQWLKQGMTSRDLADEYGVCEHTMRKYLRQFEKGVVREWQ